MKYFDTGRPRTESQSDHAQQTTPSGSPVYADNHGHAKQSKEGWHSIVATVLILLAAPLLAFFLTVFVFQTYQVDGPSMKNTLESNDRLIVWKLPRTWSRITGHAYIPQRDEVVVFTEPQLGEFGEPEGKQLIKRVIALPGERVVIKNGTVTVYNHEHPDGFKPDTTLSADALASKTLGSEDVTIPDNHVYVMGDNRANSLDSRSFGPIDVKNIVGKLTFRILPFDQARRF